MARNVADLAMFLSVIAGFDTRAPLSLLDSPRQFAGNLARDFKGTRVGWLGDYEGYLPTQAGVLDVCETALKHLVNLGCTVDAVQPQFCMDRLWKAFLVIRGTVVAGGLQELYDDPAKRALLKPEAIDEVERGQAASAADFFQASVTRSAWYLELERLFESYDFLVLPAAQVFPFDVQDRWPSEIAGRAMDTYHRWMEVVIGPTLAGLPALAVPAGFSSSGLPMGIQLVGRRNHDLEVLQLGYAYEAASQYAS